MKSPLPTRDYVRRRRLRVLRALLLAAGSGGLVLLVSAFRVLQVARLASCRAGGARLLLVPGYRLDRSEVAAPFAHRLRRAMQLWRRDPQCRLLLSGAAAHSDATSEAQGGLGYLSDLGLPADAEVLLDGTARDTEENLLNTVVLLQRWVDVPVSDSLDDSLDKRTGDLQSVAALPVAIVSNRWHLARCAWLARRHGLQWRVCAAEARWRPRPFDWLALLREALSLMSFAGLDAARIDPKKLLRPQR